MILAQIWFILNLVIGSQRTVIKQWKRAFESFQKKWPCAEEHGAWDESRSRCSTFLCCQTRRKEETTSNPCGSRWVWELKGNGHNKVSSLGSLALVKALFPLKGLDLDPFPLKRTRGSQNRGQPEQGNGPDNPPLSPNQRLVWWAKDCQNNVWGPYDASHNNVRGPYDAFRPEAASGLKASWSILTDCGAAQQLLRRLPTEWTVIKTL